MYIDSQPNFVRILSITVFLAWSSFPRINMVGGPPGKSGCIKWGFPTILNATNGNLYVANTQDNTVSVISGNTNTVIGNPIPVGRTPVAIAFDSTSGDIYVANGDDNTVSVISTTVTRTQSIQQLIQLKHSMHLAPATDQTLDIQLNAALQFAQNNMKSGTCLELGGFIKQVQGAFRVGHVTSTQATQLIQAAQNIQRTLGCTVTSSGNGIGALSPLTSSASSFNSNQSQQQSKTTASSPSSSAIVLISNKK
jgi:YVTN family beta-propeller protein